MKGGLIQVSEAAERLGVNRQTMENWCKSGVIKIKRMGKTRNADWVDGDTIAALRDTIADVEHARQALESEKAEIEASYRTIHEKTNELRREVFMVNKFGQMCVSREFYLSIPGMLESLNILKPREAAIMHDIIEGQDYEEIGERFGLTRERVRQIFYRGCQKARNLEDIKGCLNENFALKSENHELKRCINMMREEIKELQKPEQLVCEGNADDITKLLNTKIADMDLSVRVLTCLKSADIVTIGDLCKYKQSDLLRFRNFGRRSLTELEDFLESIGLRFGMDVDRIRMNAIVNSDKL